MAVLGMNAGSDAVTENQVVLAPGIDRDTKAISAQAKSLRLRFFKLATRGAARR